MCMMSRMITYCPFPPIARQMFYVWNVAANTNVTAQPPDFIPMRRAFNSFQHARPYWNHLTDLMDVPSLAYIRPDTIIYTVQDENMPNFPVGLYRARVMVRWVVFFLISSFSNFCFHSPIFVFILQFLLKCFLLPKQVFGKPGFARSSHPTFWNSSCQSPSPPSFFQPAPRSRRPRSQFGFRFFRRKRS